MLKIARNLVDYESGRTILETAMEIQRQDNATQYDLFDNPELIKTEQQ